MLRVTAETSTQLRSLHFQAPLSPPPRLPVQVLLGSQRWHQGLQVCCKSQTQSHYPALDMLLSLESCSCSWALFVSAAKELWQVWFLVGHAELSAKPGCGPELHQCLLLEQPYARGYSFPRSLLMWISCLYLRINIINDQNVDFVCSDCPQRFFPLSREILISWISSPESQDDFQLLEGFIALFTISTKDSLCNLFCFLILVLFIYYWFFEIGWCSFTARL